MRERTGKEVERKKIKWPDIVVHHNKTIKALAADPFLSVFIFFIAASPSCCHVSVLRGAAHRHVDGLGQSSFCFHFISMYFLLTANTIKYNHGLNDYLGSTRNLSSERVKPP